MDTPDNNRTKVRDFFRSRLAAKGDLQSFEDDDSLIISRRLDSLDTVETVVFLEDAFGIDFTKYDFDQSLVDSVNAVMNLLTRR
jgi:acyl carrier protein